MEIKKFYEITDNNGEKRIYFKIENISEFFLKAYKDKGYRTGDLYDKKSGTLILEDTFVTKESHILKTDGFIITDEYFFDSASSLNLSYITFKGAKSPLKVEKIWVSESSFNSSTFYSKDICWKNSKHESYIGSFGNLLFIFQKNNLQIIRKSADTLETLYNVNDNYIESFTFSMQYDTDLSPNVLKLLFTYKKESKQKKKFLYFSANGDELILTYEQKTN